VTATAGSGGVFITEADGAAFTATATGAGPISLASTTGTLTIAGATSAGIGPIAISGDAIVQNANLTTGGPITVTAAAGPITMTGGSQSTAGGNITYQAAGDITLRLLTSGAAAGVTSTGGSILDGNAAALNVSAGTTTALQAGGVIGTLADPLEIAVVGLANVNANGAQSGVSININGTTGDNTLHFPLTVPGQIFFNGILLFPIATPLAPRVPQGLNLGVYEQVIASCELSTVKEELVWRPTACRAEVSAKQELAAPPPEPGESP
jgi:hypothetical protein